MLAEVADRFRALVTRPEHEVEASLDEVALLAAAASRDLDRAWVAGQLSRLDAVAAACGPGLDGLRTHLFEDLGLRGDVEGYGDPAASYLDRVLDRRRGMPIALCLLTAAVGRRTGVPLRLVGLPGHVVVRHEGEPPALLDCFDGGRALRDADVARLVARSVGGPVEVEASWLEPTPATAIATRLLTNLRQRALATGDVALLGWVAPLRASIPGVGDGDLRLLARLQASLN